jgi:hypothetical protein
MEIKDLNGLKIRITDLERAIEMAEFFKDCHHTPPHPMDEQRQAYWKDFYEKLIKQKSKKTKPNEQSRR